MRRYIPRIVDSQLGVLINGLPALAIDGPRAIGKTETAKRYAHTVHALDDPMQREIAFGDVSRLLSGTPPVLIDEWQRIPEVWDLVRRAVDRQPSATGRFILTGSATPVEAPTHPGAGRIVRVRMHPLALAERERCPPTVSLAELLSGHRPSLEGDSSLNLRDYASEIVGSGLPAIRGLPDVLRNAQLDSYLDNIIEYDVGEYGRTVRDRMALRSWLAAYAAATSTPTSYARIAGAALGRNGNTPAKNTVSFYRRTLENLWVLSDQPGWLPTTNRMRRLTTAPSHHLADPALAARLLGLSAEALIDGREPAGRRVRDGPMLGALFESLMVMSVRVYAQANDARVSHFRTKGGEREVDIIVERRDGGIVALEVKLATYARDSHTRHLRWLRRQLGDRLLDSAVITTGSAAYRRADGIGVIPAALLTA